MEEQGHLRGEGCTSTPPLMELQKHLALEEFYITYTFNYICSLILFFAVFHSFSLSFPFLINNFETELNNGWFGGQC